ncbi:unnamed protein product [Pedinophyceae sp. YPF-701]|nr:unnamed protein product [Pedinophyceae sp. YPF-701]
MQDELRIAQSVAGTLALPAGRGAASRVQRAWRLCGLPGPVWHEMAAQADLVDPYANGFLDTVSLSDLVAQSSQDVSSMLVRVLDEVNSAEDTETAQRLVLRFVHTARQSLMRVMAAVKWSNKAQVVHMTQDATDVALRHTMGVHRAAESLKMLHGEARMRSDAPFPASLMLDTLQGRDPTMPARAVAPEPTSQEAIQLSSDATARLRVLTLAKLRQEPRPDGAAVTYVDSPQPRAVLHAPGLYRATLMLAPIRITASTRQATLDALGCGDAVKECAESGQRGPGGESGARAAGDAEEDFSDTWRWAVEDVAGLPGSASGSPLHSMQIGGLKRLLQGILDNAEVVRECDAQTALLRTPHPASMDDRASNPATSMSAGSMEEQWGQADWAGATRTAREALAAGPLVAVGRALAQAAAWLQCILAARAARDMTVEEGPWQGHARVVRGEAAAEAGLAATFAVQYWRQAPRGIVAAVGEPAVAIGVDAAGALVIRHHPEIPEGGFEGGCPRLDPETVDVAGMLDECVTAMAGALLRALAAAVHDAAAKLVAKDARAHAVTAHVLGAAANTRASDVVQLEVAVDGVPAVVVSVDRRTGTPALSARGGVLQGRPDRTTAAATVQDAAAEVQSAALEGGKAALAEIAGAAVRAALWLTRPSVAAGVEAAGRALGMHVTPGGASVSASGDATVVLGLWHETLQRRGGLPRLTVVAKGTATRAPGAPLLTSVVARIAPPTGAAVPVLSWDVTSPDIPTGKGGSPALTSDLPPDVAQLGVTEHDWAVLQRAAIQAREVFRRQALLLSLLAAGAPCVSQTDGIFLGSAPAAGEADARIVVQRSLSEADATWRARAPAALFAAQASWDLSTLQHSPLVGQLSVANGRVALRYDLVDGQDGGTLLRDLRCLAVAERVRDRLSLSLERVPSLQAGALGAHRPHAPRLDTSVPGVVGVLLGGVKPEDHRPVLRVDFRDPSAASGGEFSLKDAGGVVPELVVPGFDVGSAFTAHREMLRRDRDAAVLEALVATAPSLAAMFAAHVDAGALAGFFSASSTLLVRGTLSPYRYLLAHNYNKLEIGGGVKRARRRAARSGSDGPVAVLELSVRELGATVWLSEQVAVQVWPSSPGLEKTPAGGHGAKDGERGPTKRGGVARAAAEDFVAAFVAQHTAAGTQTAARVACPRRGLGVAMVPSLLPAALSTLRRLLAPTIIGAPGERIMETLD